MNDSNKKASHIKINGEAYKMINVLTSNGELIASISAKDVIHDVNYQVQLIKAND
ncbi:hypothetical protein KSL82_06775 [Limosilactobacillus portuensis]|uniref:Uncharacterized protein n=1 Tax=Limosilactobacillus portuensis TaxID=2742601 RepID=A0ABS6IX83_9LACO|nr:MULTISPECIES: hypothetical protein [Limosilactobacillus]MBU9695596.1 hypothetical protein [Limosilactobacillus portuensis]